MECNTCSGICDMHCLKCGTDVYEKNSVAFVKWNTVRKTNTLLGTICIQCWKKIESKM